MEGVIGSSRTRGLRVCAVLLGLVQLLCAGCAFAAPAGPAGCAADAAPVVSVAPIPADDVILYVVTSFAHTDLVFPRVAFESAPFRIKSAVDRLPEGPWIVIGWGPYWFGRSTAGGPYHPLPRQIANGVWSLVVPQFRSRLRLAALAKPGPAPLEPSNALIPVRMSAAGLQRALERMDSSFETGRDGGPVASSVAGAAPGVAIYRSHEFYNVIHECNQWVAEVLAAGGVKAAPFLDIMPGALKFNLGREPAAGGPVAARSAP